MQNHSCLSRYEALFESSGPQPDFHRLEKFQPLDLGESLLEGNKGQGGKGAISHHVTIRN